ncbi:hypothetical protein [Streptomyces sp. NPDC058876]|uniref:hypothetical protein n=1 Tax=Streptomyces sp. NPDC058876 TaxID=3346664 RepID=UPI00368A1FCF
MTTLRNLAIDTLRGTGYTGIAAGLREVSSAPHSRPLDLLSLSRPAQTPNRPDYESALLQGLPRNSHR